MSLRELVIHSARYAPDNVAIKDPNGQMTYRELDCYANQCARALANFGVGPGDRVGIWLEKSTSTVTIMQAVLRLKSIYVPLDPMSPVNRICLILRDCDIKLVVTTRERKSHIMDTYHEASGLTIVCLDELDAIFNRKSLLSFPNKPFLEPDSGDDDIVYILYTSGSTGKPKGVCISNRNALAFIEWAAGMLQATSQDRFANHASFHFDLSVLDLYCAFKVSATVYLIPDNISYLPARLTEVLLQERPTIWYSVPSVLILMMEQGGLFQIEHPSLRALLYAGEPFPVKQLKHLRQHWPHVRIFNLYGPTETNVCTYYEVGDLPNGQKHIPIGRACSGDTVYARKDDGTTALPGEEGELIVSGPTVMVGYWGKPKQGKRPYATGDIVRLESDGNYVYIGRRDHLIKVRGYRVELGDIETALEEHPAIREAIVVVQGSGISVRLVAFIVSVGAVPPSLLEIKRHCAERLPRYMIVDAVRVLAELPRTRNGKVDRLTLTKGEIEL